MAYFFFFISLGFSFSAKGLSWLKASTAILHQHKKPMSNFSFFFPLELLLYNKARHRSSLVLRGEASFSRFSPHTYSSYVASFPKAAGANSLFFLFFCSWKMRQLTFCVKLGWFTSTPNWSNVFRPPEFEPINESSCWPFTRKFFSKRNSIWEK